MSDNNYDGNDTRKPSVKNAVATGSGLGLVIGLAHYVIKGFATGHWEWHAPDDGLIDVAGPILLLPLGHYIMQVLTLIGTIIINHLEKSAKE